MACVILIHAKNWQERNRVLGCLDDDICSVVIVDLMKYVEDKYKVRFVKEEEDGDGDSTQITAVEPVENKNIPLLAVMVQNDQITESRENISASVNTVVPEEDGYGTFIPYRNRMVEPKEENVVIQTTVGKDIPVVYLNDTDQSIVNMEDDDTVGEQPANECDIYSPEVVPQHEDIAQNDQVLTDVADNNDIPLITLSFSNDGNIDNDLHTDDTETEVPCLENVDTPVTARRSTRSMKTERNVIENKDEDAQKGNTKSLNVDNGPSTSTVRRSGRVAKRPAYSMDDEDGEEENSVPTKDSSKSGKREGRKNGDESVTIGIECMKCLKQFSADYRRYSRAKEHAVIHTDLVRFECPVDGCGFKCRPRRNFEHHARYKHGQHLSAKNVDLTTEQKEELDQIVKECFPAFGTKNEYKVCTVCQSPVANNSIDQHNLKRHSLQHVEFMLYKCNQSKCKYECKSYKHMIEHGRKKHKIEEISKKETEIELTDQQKEEIDEMMKTCFSTNDINNTVSAGMECKKCSKKMSCRWYSDAKEHAIIHTDLKRYECPADGCDYICGLGQTFRDHVRIKHNNRLLAARKIDLTNEQEEKLEQMIKECFPEITIGNKYQVCKVCQEAVSNNSINQYHPKRHALQHIDFMIYKCNQPKCQYEAKHYPAMIEHGRKKHKIEKLSKEDTEIKLTDDQKKKIDDMFKKCFPNDDDE